MNISQLHKICALFFTLLFLSSCSTCSKETEGPGGSNGSATVCSACGGNPCRPAGEDLAVSIPELESVYAGSALGKILPRDERLIPARALYAILVTNGAKAKASWASSTEEPTYRGALIVDQAVVTPDYECRSYKQTIRIDNTPHSAYGKLCRTKKNFWKIVEEHPLDRVLCEPETPETIKEKGVCCCRCP